MIKVITVKWYWYWLVLEVISVCGITDIQAAVGTGCCWSHSVAHFLPLVSPSEWDQRLHDLITDREEEQFVFVLWPYGPISRVTTPQSPQDTHSFMNLCVCFCVCVRVKWPWRPSRTLNTAPSGHLRRWSFSMHHLACDHCLDCEALFTHTKTHLMS